MTILKTQDNRIHKTVKVSKDSYKDELLQYTKQLDFKSQKDVEQTNERAIQELLVLLKDSF